MIIISNAPMEKGDLAEIKKWFEKGDISQLAIDHGISASQAENILAGRSKNYAFLEKALALALKRKQTMMAGIEKLKNLNAV